MISSSISTRVASELLSVHESSIKRWCNAGELDFWHTPGGHRRIPIAKLVSFAQARGLEAPILTFGNSAERVWIGMETARREDEFAILSQLALEWISLGRVYLVEFLIVFLVDQGFGLGRVFDDVIGSAMRFVGNGYASGEITIGQEHRMTHALRDALIGIANMLSAEDTDAERTRIAVAGCIRGEVHEIGALMIRLILIRNGWNVVYLGQNVPTEEFHSVATEHGAELICISLVSPMGDAEAHDVVRLLSELHADSRPIRLAVGGSTLTEPHRGNGTASLEEVAFFRKAEPFESWLSAVPA